MPQDLAILPDEYRTADEDDLEKRIRAKKEEFGKKLLILTHHYQRVEIVRMGDRVGDSYGLAKIAANSPDAETIAFCGVHFMAEAADVLTAPNQKVYLTNATAGCPMADMAPTGKVYDAWDSIESVLGKNKVVPISYMNTTADLKAFTGRNGGLICTSSNADAAFKWAYERFEKLFFFPDQHLGRNTAKKYGVPKDQVVLYDTRKPGGGIDENTLKKARVILWQGHCYVHTKFKPEHIDLWREKNPKVKIVVHPECPEDVVDKADAVGSTSYIVEYCEEAPPGSVIAIGTELNLIHRMAVTHKDKKIYELAGDTCPVCSNMFRTTLADLCYTLENPEKANQIVVPDEIKKDAKIALERMLEIGK
ncbi:MAG: quinolinate synthase NadA [Candidatus Zixiibacteriota bacterium]|nr:MAG: quinolinate synthase NadA [candidate division Zixibacteria bacterium]